VPAESEARPAIRPAAVSGAGVGDWNRCLEGAAAGSIAGAPGAVCLHGGPVLFHGVPAGRNWAGGGARRRPVFLPRSLAAGDGSSRRPPEYERGASRAVGSRLLASLFAALFDCRIHASEPVFHFAHGGGTERQGLDRADSRPGSFL